MGVRCYSQSLIDSGIGLGPASCQAVRLIGRLPGRQVESILDLAFASFVYYLMASLVFKNRKPKTVKLAENTSTVG